MKKELLLAMIIIVSLITVGCNQPSVEIDDIKPVVENNQPAFMIHCKLDTEVKFVTYFADVKVGSKTVDPEKNLPVVPISLESTDTLSGKAKVIAKDMNENELDTFEKTFSGPEISINGYHYSASWETDIGDLTIEEINVSNSGDFLLPVEGIVAEMDNQTVEGHADKIIKPGEKTLVELYDIRFEDINNTKEYRLEISIHLDGELIHKKTLDIRELQETISEN